MKANYVDTDFRRAMDIVGAAFQPKELAQGIGVDWDYLAWLGIGVAEEALGPHGQRLEAVANGAEAFTAGFLIGAYLPQGAGLHGRGDTVAWAVERVRERGRHAVIADYCDLDTVARFEQVYAQALVDGVAIPEVERSELRGPLTILFESGLATGLVLGEV
jgi:hypothetical protein